LEDALTDFADTAAAIAQFDLVVAVDIAGGAPGGRLKQAGTDAQVPN